jgi:DNA topoisomerase IA
MALRKEKGDKTFGEHFQKLYEKMIAYMRTN